MKRTKLLLAALAVLLSAAVSFGQNITVKGSVSDQQSYPVIGAAVMVPGTTNGVVTDANGEYTIKVPANGKLQVSVIGYKIQTVDVAGRVSINFVLEEDAEALEGTIVVGYGSAQKIGNIVGSITTVSADEITNRPSANIGDALQGKVAGLQIFNTSGEPQSSVNVKLRGNSSLNLSTAPLYILDGVPVSSSVFNDINPQDIENISVLKDASSTAIYGSRAANGVIYISTKKGRKGESPTVSVRAQHGISLLTNYPLEMMNSAELIQFEEMARPSLKLDPAYQAQKAFILGNNIDFDWTSYLYDKSAPLTQADVSIRGASDKSTYYISAGYYSEKGTSKANSSVDRFNFRTNVDTQVRKWLKVGANLSLNYSKYHTITTGWYTQSPILQAVTGLPYHTPYSLVDNGDGTWSYGDVQWIYPWDGMIDLNEYYKYNTNDRESASLMGQTYVQVQPFKGFTIRAAQAIDAFDYTNESINMPSYTPYTYRGRNGQAFQRYYQLSSTNTMEYKFDIADAHHFTALLGHESIIKKEKTFSATGTGLTDDRLTTFGTTTAISTWAGTTIEQAMNSFFFNFNYNMNAKYFLDASVRTDGSSVFGKNHRYATFYSVGAMWKIKQEPFMEDVNWVTDLNTNLSYGTTGNSGLSDWYASLGLVGAGSKYDGHSAWGLSQVPNDDLTWETVATLNWTLNGRLWDRLSFDVQLYDRQSSNLLMELPFSGTTGHSSGNGNIAAMNNRGVDLELGLDLVHTKNVYWGVRANVNYNRNKITKLYQGLDELAFPDEGLKYQVGYSSSLVYVVERAYVDPADGMPVYYDLNRNYTKTYSDDLMQFWEGHDSVSPWSGGFSTNFSWGGLGINADFSWIGDRYIWLNERYYTRNPNSNLLTSNFEKVMLNMWTTPGQVTDIPKADTVFRFDTGAYSNAAFLRMKNVSISYTFPKKLMEKTKVLSGAKIYAIGRNLLTFTNYEGYDPEVGYSNGTQGLYPNSRQIVGGVELSF